MSYETASEPSSVYTHRGYKICSVAEAKSIAQTQLDEWSCADHTVSFGLPEVDDRYHVWRVPLVNIYGGRLGEIVIDARTGDPDTDKSSNPSVLSQRVDVQQKRPVGISSRRAVIARSNLRNTIISGRAEVALTELPSGSVDLVFTSPPYFNARPDYTEYAIYEEYLNTMRKVIQQCHRLLSEGRFFVLNVSPVLVRRVSRSESSRRIAVPFDIHRIVSEEGFDFIDDIIWQKPSGAGWATGRGRRFAADRNPLQYKAVPVTEYVLVYRKHTNRLIDWNIRNHPDQAAVSRSRIEDDYERTNVWKIRPAHSKDHPAVFPEALVDRVVRYYSFETDVVLDPFAGSGTVGKVASELGRRFVLVEMDPEYVELIRRNVESWLGTQAKDVLCIGCRSLSAEQYLF